MILTELVQVVLQYKTCQDLLSTSLLQFEQLAASLIFSTCINIDAFIRLAARCSIMQTCCKLTFADLMQVVSSTCIKSANVNLQQA
jgi:hypothetical protein